MQYLEAKAYVESFSHSGKPVHDLSRIAGLMQKLGDPQDRLKFIHIAGTNGKGSVAEYLTNIFMEGGYRTGTFTSPYIRHYRDRIRLNGADIPERELCACCEQVKAAARPEDGYSQFEITFAIAMLYFVQSQAEIVILEAGLGGLLDCTNLIKSPEACVLTTIALDHMAILGNTIEEIAAQKMGIIKPGSCVVISPKNELSVVRSVFDRARELGIKAYYPEMNEEHFEMLRCDLTGTQFRFWRQNFETVMGGEHQIANALTAIETVYALGDKGWNLPGLAVERGIARTQIPGRMQLISKYPPTLLDGGHNADGIEALAKALHQCKNTPIIGIIGMTHADAADAAAEKLGRVFDKVLCVDGFTPGAMPAKELDAKFDSVMGGEHSQSVALSDAMKIAKSWTHRNGGSIVICGSLYLASWFLNGA